MRLSWEVIHLCKLRLKTKERVYIYVAWNKAAVREGEYRSRALLGTAHLLHMYISACSRLGAG